MGPGLNIKTGTSVTILGAGRELYRVTLRSESKACVPPLPSGTRIFKPAILSTSVANSPLLADPPLNRFVKRVLSTPLSVRALVIVVAVSPPADRPSIILTKDGEDPRQLDIPEPLHVDRDVQESMVV